MSVPSDKNNRAFVCREPLWSTFTRLASERQCSVDDLITEAMRRYAARRPSAPLPSALDAAGLGCGVRVGRAFAFAAPHALASPALGFALSALAPNAERARVVSLLGPHAIELGGVRLPAPDLPTLSLGVVTSDKALYRQCRDRVRLLVCDPSRPGAEVVLDVRAQGAPFGRHPLRLDEAGAGAASLSDLPLGDYEVCIADAPEDDVTCTFTVAEYRLAPLVASLATQHFDRGVLRFALELTSFGAPVDGAVHLELADGARRVARIGAVARAGRVEAELALDGAGPFSIHVQLQADAAKTATVPIVGSRAEERSLTALSRLGVEAFASLLPGDGARAVRGLYLSTGATNNAPIALERVDARTVRLTARTAIGPMRVVAVDPTFVRARPDAVDPTTAPHPGQVDDSYRKAEAAFLAGRIDEARHGFTSARQASRRPHPNYAYYLACCHAREGDLTAALRWLRTAFADGWVDTRHMAEDSDLAALRGDPMFASLCAGGRRETFLARLDAGERIDIEACAPFGLILVGAFVGDAPWEGWAFTIAPPAIDAKLEAPERAKPGALAKIAIAISGAERAASAYVVVKDARLLVADTPLSRLAGQAKRCAEDLGAALAVGEPKQTLGDLAATASDDDELTAITRTAERSSGAAIPPPPGGHGLQLAGMPRGFGAIARAFGGPPPSAPAAAMAYSPAPASAPLAAPRHPYRQAPTGAAPRDHAARPSLSVDEPEVLFAELVPIHAGRGEIGVTLGDAPAEYVVEAFVLSGADWCAATTRITAMKETFASFDVPAFVHPSDVAMGRVHLGCASGHMRVRVTCNGADVALTYEAQPLTAGAVIATPRAEVSFVAAAGDYEVVVEDVEGGGRDEARARVDVPGRLRRVARTVRMLQPGEQIRRSDDPAIRALRILPALDRPFTALVEATTDYGHACCEQTAAKLLAACAMFVLADGDGERRRKAEATIVAGVRRERSMWLRSRGFKMYPETRNEPDAYWGAQAARHLMNVALLFDAAESLPPALAASCEEAVAMATDALGAYGTKWPTTTLASCRDAYEVSRFGAAARAPDAFAYVRQCAAGVLTGAFAQRGGAVAARAERAYAAATLLRGPTDDRRLALDCANRVLADLGPEGRLYSTVDSVAAIALMAELRSARVLGGGAVEVDGRKTTINAAASSDAAPEAVRAIEGVVAIEVARTVEESWEALRVSLPMATWLTRSDAPTTPTSRLRLGDAVDLHVRLEQGYRPGDLLWVCLPDALTRLVGGGQVKRFSVDFAGRTEITVPLAATAVTHDARGAIAPQHFAVCVRNMFEEERAGNPGLLELTITA